LLSKFSNKRSLSGFTIIELLVAMAVAAVLLGLALPAFDTFIEQRSMTARVNGFISAVNLARSEAVNRGGQVSIQAMNAGDNADEWGPGYCVVVGTPGNCPNDPAVLIREFDNAGAATLDATGGLNGLGTLTFNGRGLMTLGAQGTIEICEAGVTTGREIAINTIGRAASAELACP
jgi:prepilin-type N-terminal cleavage/methylation domain-containing protein